MQASNIPPQVRYELEDELCGRVGGYQVRVVRGVPTNTNVADSLVVEVLLDDGSTIQQSVEIPKSTSHKRKRGRCPESASKKKARKVEDEAAEQPGATFSALPQELQEYIFLMLPWFSIIPLKAVCKDWRHVLSSDSFWRTLFKKDFGGSPFLLTNSWEERFRAVAMRSTAVYSELDEDHFWRVWTVCNGIFHISPTYPAIKWLQRDQIGYDEAIYGSIFAGTLDDVKEVITEMHYAFQVGKKEEKRLKVRAMKAALVVGDDKKVEYLLGLLADQLGSLEILQIFTQAIITRRRRWIDLFMIKYVPLFDKESLSGIRLFKAQELLSLAACKALRIRRTDVFAMLRKKGAELLRDTKNVLMAYVIRAVKWGHADCIDYLIQHKSELGLKGALSLTRPRAVLPRLFERCPPLKRLPVLRVLMSNAPKDIAPSGLIVDLFKYSSYESTKYLTFSNTLKEEWVSFEGTEDWSREAATNATREMVEYAIELGVDFGHGRKGRNLLGRKSALFYAVKRRQPLSIIRFLVENGADVNAANSRRNTPLNLAKKRKDEQKEVYEYLLTHS